MEVIAVFIFAFIAYAFIVDETKKAKRKAKKVEKFFGVSSSKTKSTTFSPKSDDKIIKEAEVIAEKIKTHKGIEALEDRIDRAEEKSQSRELFDDEVAYAKNEEKIAIMREALYIAEENPFRYYFYGELDADTPLEFLKLVGKPITQSKYDEIDKEYKDDFEIITLRDCSDIEDAKKMANTFGNESEKQELKDLINFRKLIESDLSEEEKAKKFNKLVAKSEYLLDELKLDDEPELEEYDNEFDASLYGQFMERYK